MRTINADVVLAGLDRIQDALAERASYPTVRISIARSQVKNLRQQIENIAEETP